MADAAPFRKLASTASNRLAAYVTNMAGGAVGVLAVAALQDGAARLAGLPRALLLAALLLAAATVCLRLLALQVQAQRLRQIAAHLDMPASGWARDDRKLAALCLRLSAASYWGFAAMLGCLLALAVARLA